jgi:anaerobic magnesium-protoporphyrin IX monomethyl ester cyclase
MFRVALIYPPGGDPRAPRLPLPALAAVLRPAGIDVKLFDLDIDGVLSLLRPANLARAADKIRVKASAESPERRRNLEKMAFRAPELAETIGDAIATLRDPIRFLEPTHLNVARERMYDALDLVSAAAGRRVRYQTDVLRYDVEGVDPSRFADLLAVTADPAANLFEEHWNDHIHPVLESDGGFDFIGISLTLRWQIIPGLSLARRLRQRGHRVVLGGTAVAKIAHRLPHLPTFFDAFADGVVTREGETALLELANQLQGGKEFNRVPNFLYRDGDTVRATAVHIEDYAVLPTPDFDGMPLSRYLSPQLVLPVMVGKGCYHDECKFCDIPFINRISPKRYRVRNAETIAGDLETLSRKHGCRHFLLADEALPPRVLDRIADALETRRDFQPVFSGYARLEPGFTAQLCEKLARVGLRRIYFGLESANQATLDQMAKGIRVENAHVVLRNCANAGISFHVFSIIGFPGEDAARARQTIEFFEANEDLFDDPGNTFDIHQLEILTDTPYFSRAASFGIRILEPTEDRDFLFGIGTSWENTKGLSRDEIADLLGEAQQRIGSRFSRYHAWPPILWPAQEEWSLIYAGEYFRQPFPHRVSVPDGSDPSLYRLVWNRAAVVERNGETCVVTSRRGRVELDHASFRLLGEDPRYRPAADIIVRLSGDDARAEEVARVRDFVTGLVRGRLLDVVREPDPRYMVGTENESASVRLGE